MKVTNWLLAAALLVLATASLLPAQTDADELDMALRDASDYLNDNIPKGSKIVILNIESGSANLSEYIIEEITANAVNDKTFSVVDRRQLETIQAEQKFQMSGAVDDKDAQAIGKFFGAQTIISGTMSDIGGRYRLTIRALDVKTAEVQGQFNRNMPISETLAGLVGIVVGGGQSYGGGSQSYGGSSEKTLITLNDGRGGRGGSGGGVAEVGGDGGSSEKTPVTLNRGSGRGVGGAATVAEPEYQAAEKTEQNRWAWSGSFGIGASFMLDMIDTLYGSAGGQFSLDIERLNLKARFFRFGLNLETGGLVGVKNAWDIVGDEIQEKHPDITSDDISIDSYFGKAAVFLRLFPIDALYLSGGAGLGWYTASVKPNSDYGLERISLVSVLAPPVFSVGAGLVIPASSETHGGFLIDAHYNIVQLKEHTAGYWSVKIGAHLGRGI